MKSIKVINDDITSLNIDIIVNAANESLLGGGGVDGQIHRKAGPKLLEECRGLGGCKTGQAKMTDAYNLPCKKIIHTVGPVYRDGNHGEEELLKSCYENSIKLAEEYRVQNNLDEITIAFPNISTGVYRFPKEEAASLVVKTLNELDYKNINVLLCCFDIENYNIYMSKI